MKLAALLLTLLFTAVVASDKSDFDLAAKYASKIKKTDPNCPVSDCKIYKDENSRLDQ